MRIYYSVLVNVLFFLIFLKFLHFVRFYMISCYHGNHNFQLCTLQSTLFRIGDGLLHVFLLYVINTTIIVVPKLDCVVKPNYYCSNIKIFLINLINNSCRKFKRSQCLINICKSDINHIITSKYFSSFE